MLLTLPTLTLAFSHIAMSLNNNLTKHVYIEWQRLAREQRKSFLEEILPEDKEDLLSEIELDIIRLTRDLKRVTASLPLIPTLDDLNKRKVNAISNALQNASFDRECILLKRI
jgi:hypothetical protein